MTDKILYLGPRGSYSETAKNKFAEKCFTNHLESYSLNSIQEIVRELININSESIFAVLPIENSIEGIVRETQDSLLALSNLGFGILAETNLLIEHSLIGFGDKSQIKTITSHPQALAQCRDYIYENWEDKIELIPVLSTSAAVSMLKQNKPETAAIGNKYCAELYNIPVIETLINDENNNTTRFVLLSKIKPQKSDINKVSIVFSTENKPGALNFVLSILEKYGLNMSYIDSRPSRKELGEYVFYVDLAGHIEDNNISLALTEIQTAIKMFAILSNGCNCV